MSSYAQVERPLLTKGSTSPSIQYNSSNWSLSGSDYDHQSGVIVGTYPKDETETVSTISSIRRTYRETRGWDNPNFYERQRRGELLPPTKFDQVDYSVDVAGRVGFHLRNFEEDFSTHSTSYHSDQEAVISSNGDFLPSDFEAFASSDLYDFGDEEAAIDSYDPSVQVQAAAARIYSQGFDALTSGAEFHKTVRLFKSIRKRLIRELSRGRLFDLYLEGRYGWRILIYELLELNDVVNNWSKERSRYTEKAFGGFTSHDSFTSASIGLQLPNSTIQSWFMGTGPKYKYHVQTSRKISLLGTVTADILPSQFRHNPVETAWELIPYSFVIDWFVHFGQWIQALSFDAAASDFVAAGGVKIEISRDFTAVSNEVNDTSFSFVDPSANPGFELRGSSSAVYTRRRPSSVPSIPLYNPRLDELKVLDLIALLFAGKRRK